MLFCFHLESRHLCFCPSKNIEIFNHTETHARPLGDLIIINYFGQLHPCNFILVLRMSFSRFFALSLSPLSMLEVEYHSRRERKCTMRLVHLCAIGVFFFRMRDMLLMFAPFHFLFGHNSLTTLPLHIVRHGMYRRRSHVPWCCLYMDNRMIFLCEGKIPRGMCASPSSLFSLTYGSTCP